MKKFFETLADQVKEMTVHSEKFRVMLFLIVMVVITTSSGVRAWQLGKAIAESGQISWASIGVLFGLLGILLGFSIDKYYSIKSRKFGKRQTKRTIDFNQLCRICDLIPTPCLRKRVKKLLADQEAHLSQLKRSRRLWAARWIVLTTWILVGWYVLVSPMTALTQALAGVFKGAGD